MNLEFDSESKKFSCQVNGVEIPNVMAVSLYCCGDEDEDGGRKAEICIDTMEKSDGMRKYSRICASEQAKPGDLLIGDVALVSSPVDNAKSYFTKLLKK